MITTEKIPCLHCTPDLPDSIIFRHPKTIFMSLRLVNVLNGSTPDEECVRFRVGADMNLQGYALVQ